VTTRTTNAPQNVNQRPFAQEWKRRPEPRPAGRHQRRWNGARDARDLCESPTIRPSSAGETPRLRTGVSSVTGPPVLAGVAVLGDGTKRLVSLEVCGAEPGTAWEGFLQGLIDRGLKAPRLHH
jgi:hypothetical protein